LDVVHAGITLRSFFPCTAAVGTIPHQDARTTLRGPLFALLGRMMLSMIRHRSYPRTCPRCGARAGLPNPDLLLLIDNHVMLELMCFGCAHLWSVSDGFGVMLRPKKDRRRRSRT
jgi:hypothetical protein